MVDSMLTRDSRAVGLCNATTPATGIQFSNAIAAA